MKALPEEIGKMERKRGILLLVGASVLWSTAGIFTKSITWNGFAIITIRGLIAAAVMLPFIGKPRFPANIHERLAVLSYAGLVICCIVSTKLTTAANAILLQYTAPIYSALFGWKLLGEELRLRDLIAIGCLMAGMVCFLYDGLGSGSMLGNLIALLSGVCYAAMAVFMKMGDQNQPMQNVFWGNLAASVIAAPFMGTIEHTRANWILILFMAVFQLALAYILYAKAVGSLSALEITVVTVLEPILNPLWVLLLQGERPGPMALVGGVIVLGTVLVHEGGKFDADRKKETICPERSK